MFGNDTVLWKLYLWTTEEWVIFVELLLPFRSHSLYFHLLFKNLKTKIQNTINLAFASCGHESSSKEGDGLGVFKKAVSRRLFGPNLKWQEVGENCIMISFVISIREPKLFSFTWFLNHTFFFFSEFQLWCTEEIPVWKSSLCASLPVVWWRRQLWWWQWWKQHDFVC
jgi:hypothetical protein